MAQYTKMKISSKQKRQGIRKLEKPTSKKAGYIKMDETKNEYRFRVSDPSKFVSFYVLPSKDYEGLYYVKGVDKNGNHLTQSVRFKKEFFSKTYAKKFMAKRKVRKDQEA